MNQDFDPGPLALEQECERCGSVYHSPAAFCPTCMTSYKAQTLRPYACIRITGDEVQQIAAFGYVPRMILHEATVVAVNLHGEPVNIVNEDTGDVVATVRVSVTT